MSVQKNKNNQNIVIKLKGNYEKFAQLLDLFESGELERILGIPIVGLDSFSLKKTITEQKVKKQSLSEWLQGVSSKVFLSEEFLSEGWKSWSEFLLPREENLALGNFKSINVQNNSTIARRAWKKIDELLELKGQMVTLVITVEPEAEQEIGIIVEVIPMDKKYLPPGLKLAVSFESDSPVETEALSDSEWIRVDFAEVTGKQFGIQVSLDDTVFNEDFLV
ncbi:MAG: DUF1822 family protein [Microcystis aeruginosa SX13-01]|jgi:hypothetical protein|nr:DUF1822 family protein [Microcystis aeruginosa SX13-01]